MTDVQDEDPFAGMKIKDFTILEKLEGRATCPKCSKSRKYFCYTCYIPVPQLQEFVPRLELPVKIDIIKHASEIDGKSTAAHAAVVAPNDVSIYTYPCIPDYSSNENVVLIFPGKNALSLQEYIDGIVGSESQSVKYEDWSEPQAKRPNISQKLPISRAIFIDSTWNQSRGIYKDQRLRAIPCVVIQSRISQFWRHQHGSPRWFLATIEAVHQFLVELHIACKLGGSNISNKDSACSQNNTKANSKDSQSLAPLHNIPEGSQNKSLAHNLMVKTPVDKSSKSSTQPDKQPSKFVKNLALCRGIRSDSGDDPGIKLFGPDQWHGKYDGDYDNLLFFFRFMYHKIHTIYDHEKLRSYQRDML